MAYTIEYYSSEVEQEILSLPDTLQARYIGYSERMRIHGSHLGEPHTKALGKGLFELRLTGKEGIARVFYCTVIGKRIVMLHSFIKKTQKIPPKELAIATERLKEIKDESQTHPAHDDTR